MGVEKNKKTTKQIRLLLPTTTTTTTIYKGKKKKKRDTAHGIPRWSPTPVLTMPERTYLLRSDGMRSITVSMAVSERLSVCA